MYKTFIIFYCFFSFLFPQKIIYERPKYFELKDIFFIKQTKIKIPFNLSSLDKNSFFKYNFDEKDYYYLKIKLPDDIPTIFELKDDLDKTNIKFFLIDLNRNGWVGPYSNISNKYQLPKLTDRIKSKEILIELVIDSKYNFINPFSKIITPELNRTNFKKKDY